MTYIEKKSLSHALNMISVAIKTAEEMRKDYMKSKIIVAHLGGEVDAISITGGIAYSKMITEWITKRVKFIAPVHIHPGENELESLVKGTIRVLDGKEEARTYTE